jgi:hypothetical protein
MSSLSQIEANRRNGKVSKGPKTSEGKAIAAQNSARHGRLAHKILLPNEDANALGQMGERLREELHPAGELESLLVDRIIELTWRLGRFGKIEAGILSWHYHGVLAERAGKKAAKQTRKIPGPLDSHLGVYGEKTQSIRLGRTWASLSSAAAARIGSRIGHSNLRRGLRERQQKGECPSKIVSLLDRHRTQLVQGLSRITTPASSSSRKRGASARGIGC